MGLSDRKLTKTKLDSSINILTDKASNKLIILEI